ncbi:MAG TPA: hypothetical protein VFB14_08280 [Bryobacteraceae bacterium]|nr:hypothetical protein [Bryobacteraceae bacterium]
MRPLILALLVTGVLWADGGAVLLRNQAGSLRITVFGSPAPLRAAKNDISAMVQKTSDQSSVLNAKVSVHLTNASPEKVVAISAPATHDKATNKLLYAAELTVPSPGDWQLSVHVEANGETADVAGKVTVLAPRPPLMAYWPYFVLVPLIVFLFFVNRWLRGRRRFYRL